MPSDYMLSSAVLGHATMLEMWLESSSAVQRGNLDLGSSYCSSSIMEVTFGCLTLHIF
jgi:hypothetical protein